MIDYGFFMPQPVGYDLTQLLVGELQLGRGSAEGVADRDADYVAAYTRGLADEGLVVDEAVVHRAHALQMLIFCGLSCLPIELLDQPPSDELSRIARVRADLATYCLDLVDSTG